MKHIVKHIALVIGLYTGLVSMPLNAQNIGINTTGALPNTKAMLDVDVSASTTKMGLLVPRMTTADRNSIVAPIPESLLIYNLTTQCFEAWNQAAGVWVTFGCIGCTIPSPSTANAPIGAGTNSFTASWTLVSGATAYLLDVSTSSTFATFVSGFNGLNAGASTASTVGSLTCSATYYYRVRATNACGTSINSNTVTVLTSACATATAGACGTQVFATTNLNAGTMIAGNLNQTNNSTPEKWCYNDVPANCATHGGLYQWDEMMNYTASINCDPCGAGGRQGLCPAGYHVPTDLEWSRYEYCLESSIAPTAGTSLAVFQGVTGTRGTNTTAGPGAKMKATAANTPAWNGTNTSGFTAQPGGWNNFGTPVFADFGGYAYLWSATETAPGTAWSRFLESGNSYSARNNNPGFNGFSVRCLQD